MQRHEAAHEPGSGDRRTRSSGTQLLCPSIAFLNLRAQGRQPRAAPLNKQVGTRLALGFFGKQQLLFRIAAVRLGELLVRLQIQASQTWCERERNRIRTCIACCRRAGSTSTALLPAAGSAALLARGGGMADPSAAAAGTDGGCCIAMRRAASRWRSSSAFLAWRSSWMRCCSIKTVV